MKKYDITYKTMKDNIQKITSRKNRVITHLRAVASDSEFRAQCGEFICDGMKTLREALAYGAEIRCVLWRNEPQDTELPDSAEQFTAPDELFEYASPLRSSGGPAFTVAIPKQAEDAILEKVIVLENLQDPGNVGTVIRTANAFGIDAVILVGDCADLYNPKTVRASMGAIFRQRVLRLSLSELKSFTERNYLPLFGAALSERAADVRSIEIHRAAVAIGSEGRGLSKELLSLCGGEIIIPMCPDSESLNAAVAASVLMWEMYR